MGRTVEGGAGDRFVAERVEGVGFGNKDGSILNKRRGRRTPRRYQEFLITTGVAGVVLFLLLVAVLQRIDRTRAAADEESSGCLEEGSFK